MFNRSNIAREFNIDIAMNNEMANAIELWSNMHKNEPPWMDKNIKSLGLPGAIANELARLVTIEFKSEIKNNDFLNEIYQGLIVKLRIYCEFACAKGGLIFKPYVSDDHIEIDIIQQDNFFPVAYNSQGNITSAIFIETKVVGDNKYTRLEYHSFEGKNYVIRNNAYVKTDIDINDSSIGKQILLSSVPEWEDIQDEVILSNISTPFFSYFRIPLANIIDENSPLGVSTFSKAIDLIKEADKQYSRILWEYEATEVAINASTSLFGIDDNGNLKIPEGKERLFRTFDWENKEGIKLLETFSPDIRDSNLFNGLNNLLRRIEFNCGLAYGTLSDINDVPKTATEIKTSKQRSYSTVKDIQKALESSLKNLVLCMNELAKFYKLDSNNLDIDKDISFEWDDSLILDKDSELEYMRNDVAAGILRPELYLAKKYGVSEKEALKMMPEIENSIKTKSPYDDLEE